MPTFLEKDRVVLIALNYYRTRFLQRRERTEFARIMDIGGRSATYHASAMKRLVVLGLAERRQRTDTGISAPFRSRGSYEYRITPAGIAVLGAGDAL